MSLRLITADLDAYEAERTARLDLQADYHFAVERWDALEMARIEALAADYDARHPEQPPVLAGLEATRQSDAA